MSTGTSKECSLEHSIKPSIKVLFLVFICKYPYNRLQFVSFLNDNTYSNDHFEQVIINL